MITNLCPYNGNALWCLNLGSTNEYGYEYHFDIMAQSEVFGDNPVVGSDELYDPSSVASDYTQWQCA
jgi:hypothetical protein